MAEPPIACTLSLDELRASADSLLPGLIRDGRHVTTLPDGISIELDATSETLRRVVDVIERERRCCAFLRFELEVPPNGGVLSLTVTGPEGSAPLFADLAALAQSVAAD
jgi:hypothetical protein